MDRAPEVAAEDDAAVERAPGLLFLPAGELGPQVRGAALGDDALEIALVVSTQFGVELKSDDERNSRIFASLRTLADFVETNRSR